MAELKSMAEITLGGTFLRRALFLGGTFFNHCTKLFCYSVFFLFFFEMDVKLHVGFTLGAPSQREPFKMSKKKKKIAGNKH